MFPVPRRRGVSAFPVLSFSLLLVVFQSGHVAQAFFTQPLFSSSTSSFWTGARKESLHASSSDVTTTSSSSSSSSVNVAASSPTPPSTPALNPYVSASRTTGSGLSQPLDPIGRIDASPQALLDWVKAGRGELHEGVAFTHAPSSDAEVEGEGGTEAGTEELAGWTLQTQAPVQAGTVLVSIPNVGIATTLLRRLPTSLTEDWKLLTGESLHVGHDETSRTVLFRPLPESDESRDELMETVTTDDSVVKEYNPYREAELMERREIVISYMGGNMNRSMREILKFRIAQKKILYQVISDICHTMYGLGLVQSVNDMEELEEERQIAQTPEESSRPLTSSGGGARSLDSILAWASKTFGEDAGL
ncbi:hypothetical protein NSK_005844 [Nannochloropsis salina CCMP1776]|uniref:Transmembrane protein n=1 Tax=Nannochloropsis salina CCMP1776 TaxID=1027361 RepID=A0A4D9CXD6_9STRA|nr:hypothetical protein NSK_005844 [Nannochloropsis salina CCMP1776]|eukprot:TFJ82837.1 hypothetical protein NSK_005844 [Nannochloropsis salina CCMP1776]